MLGSDPQGLLLAASADHYGHWADWSRIDLAQPLLDERQVSSQIVEAAYCRSEFVAVLLVVALEPPRTDAEDHPATRNVVHGAGHIRQELWIAICVAGHLGAYLDLLRHLSPGGQHRPALEVLAVGVSVQRIEVIPVVHGINPDFLSGHDLTPDVVVVGMLRMELDDDTGFHVGEPFLALLGS